MDYVRIVTAMITEDPDEVKDYFAAVAVVGHGNKWLLGLSKSDDDRKDRWCFPGGGIKSGESPERAAVREAREETGVGCKAVGKAVSADDRPGVAFVRCEAHSLKMKPNHEFAALGWFTRREMKSLRLYRNVYKLIDKVT